VDSTLLFGLGVSLVSLFVRWRFPAMPKPIATAGVIIGLGLIVGSFSRPTAQPVVAGITVALALLAAAIEMLVDRKKPAAVPLEPSRALPPDPPAQRSHAGPGFVGPSITPAYLSEIYRDRTHIQADKLAATFIGKRIEVSGNVAFVTALDGTATTLSVAMDRDTQGFSSAWMLFPGDRDRLEMLRRGDAITVVGEIKDFDQGELRLIDCRLVSEA
jgi:hypothetical protein